MILLLCMMEALPDDRPPIDGIKRTEWMTQKVDADKLHRYRRVTTPPRFAVTTGEYEYEFYGIKTTET